MSIPDPWFILVSCSVRNSIIFLLWLDDIIENASSGNPMPSPNSVKLARLLTGFSNRNDLAKNIEMKAGLHGIMIAPKKNPKLNPLGKGFSNSGAEKLNLDWKSTSSIMAMLRTARIPKATGETVPITAVRDC